MGTVVTKIYNETDNKYQLHQTIKTNYDVLSDAIIRVERTDVVKLIISDELTGNKLTMTLNREDARRLGVQLLKK